MIEYLSMRDIQAVQYVQRWHMIRTNRPQNLAEHSFTVALLAGKIASLLQESPEPQEWAMILEYALTHDIAEIDYGDIPTPTKKVIEKLGGGRVLRAMEFKFWGDRGDCLDLAISKSAQKIVTLADKVEAFLYYSEEGFDQGIKDRLRSDALNYARKWFKKEAAVMEFLNGLT